MKKIFLLMIAIGLSIYTYSQSFKVTPDGLVSATDSSKHYIVIHVDSVTAQELYKRSYSYIQHNWKNPDIANNGKIEGEFLHVKTYEHNALAGKGNLGMKIYVNLKYSTNLDFKDGKIKYEIAI